MPALPGSYLRLRIQGRVLVNKPERQRLRNRPKRTLCTPRRMRSGDAVTTPQRSLNVVPVSASGSRSLNEQLAARRRDRDVLRRELSEAAQAQRRLSTPCRLRRGPFDIAGEIFPARHLSGDFLAAFETDVHLVLGVGDIAGKGLSAGMWFAHLVGLIRIFALSLKDPGGVAARISGHLAPCSCQDDSQSRRYAAELLGWHS